MLWRSVFLVLLLLLSAGCVFLQPRQLRIGMLAPLSGPEPGCGKQMRLGGQIAIEELQKEFPNQSIQLVIEDDQFNPTKALSAAQSLVQTQGIFVLIGSCNSSATLAVAPFAEQNKVLLFTPISFADAVSSAGDFVFRSAPRSTEVANAAVELALSLDENRIGVVYLNNDFGVSANTAFKTEFEKKGGRVVFEAATGPAETDFRTILLQLKEQDVRVLFVPQTSTPMASLIRQADELDYPLTLLGTHALERPEFLDAVKQSQSRILLVSPIRFDPVYFAQNPELKALQAKLGSSEVNYAVTTELANSYDAMRLVGKIMLSKCGEKPECIRDELYQTKNRVAATGLWSIDSNGDVNHARFFVNEIANGKISAWQSD